MSKSLKWKIAQKAELKWWERYLHSKPKHLYLNWKLEYWRAILNKIQHTLMLNGDSQVLDISCGPAGIFMAIEHKKVTAVDPLLDRYESRLAHFKKADYPNVEFVASSIEAFESTTQFDAVFCLNAINHVHDISLGFNKLASLLKPDGKLILSIDTHNHLLLKTLFRLIPLDVLHPHQYDLPEYKEMIESNGLKIIENLHLTKGSIFDYHLVVAEHLK